MEKNKRKRNEAFKKMMENRLDYVSKDLDEIIKDGHDITNYYYIRPARVSLSSTIYYNDVAEMDDEVSVMAEYFEEYALPILREHFDPHLIYNEKRISYDDDPDGRLLKGFSFFLNYNFFLFDQVSAACMEMREKAVRENDSLIKDFYIKLAVRLEKMLEHNVEADVISVMAP